MSRSASDHANGRIAVIGAGSVGATIALQCLTQAVCSEIIVNDVNEGLYFKLSSHFVVELDISCYMFSPETCS